MAATHASAAQALDLPGIEMNPVRDPGGLTQPAHIRHKIQRALAELFQAIVLLIPGLRQMGVQPHIVALGHGGGLAHQFF